MPNPLVTIETAITDKVKDHFGATIKACETLPAGFGAATPGRLLITTPGIYLALVKGEATNSSAGARANLTYGVYAITASLNDPTGKHARHGTATAIGAYEMVARVVPLLHGLSLADIGTLQFDGFDNLFEEALANLGLASYAAQFKIPGVHFPPPDVAGLEAFETFNVDWVFPPVAVPAPTVPLPAGEQRATDTVVLPQE